MGTVTPCNSFKVRNQVLSLVTLLTLAWVLHAAAAPPANAPTSRSGPCSLDQQPFPLPPPWRPCLPPTTQPGSTRLYFPGLWGFWENIFPKGQEREQETRPSVAHPPWVLSVRTHDCLSCCHCLGTRRGSQSKGTGRTSKPENGL